MSKRRLRTHLGYAARVLSGILAAATLTSVLAWATEAADLYRFSWPAEQQLRDDDGLRASLRNGRVYVRDGPTPTCGTGLITDHYELGPVSYRCHYYAGTSFKQRTLSVSDWFLIAGLAVFPLAHCVLHARSRLRAMHGNCCSCGYSLAHLHAPVCPECGTAIDTAPPSIQWSQWLTVASSWACVLALILIRFAQHQTHLAARGLTWFDKSDFIVPIICFAIAVGFAQDAIRSRASHVLHRLLAASAPLAIVLLASGDLMALVQLATFP